MKTNLETFKEGLLAKIYDGTIKNVYVDKDIKDYRQDDAWFSDTMISFDYKNLTVDITIYGEVRGEITTQVWDEKSHQSQFHKETIVDKNNSGELGRRLKELGINKDSEITTDFAKFVNEKRNDKNEFKIKAFIELEDNNWAELVIYDVKNEEHIDTNDASSLSEFIDMGVDKLLSTVKHYAKDNLDENYEQKEEGSSYEFIKECDYEKYEKTFCDYLNLSYESLETDEQENVVPYEEWKRSDSCKDTRKENYTIEAMFKAKGVSKVFDEKGIFTKEALEKYSEVSDEFFDGITDNLDKLCHDEDCFEEDLEKLASTNDYENYDDLE